MHVFEKLKHLIEEKGMSYTFLSVRTGIPIDAISKSLMGKRKLLADEFIAICNAAHIDVKDFEQQ